MRLAPNTYCWFISLINTFNNLTHLNIFGVDEGRSCKDPDNITGMLNYRSRRTLELSDSYLIPLLDDNIPELSLLNVSAKETSYEESEVRRYTFREKRDRLQRLMA